MTTPTTILFDLDGTLTDPKEGILRSIGYALTTLGRPVPEESDLLWCIGPPLMESFRQLLDTTSEQLVSEALRLYRDRYNRSGKFENSVYPGIPETLDALKQTGAALYIATAKPTVFADQIAAHFELARYFTKIYGSELSGERSNKKELIAHIIQSENLDPTGTIMVGDRYHDMIGAKHNGITAIGVTYGYGSFVELDQAGADVIVNRPEELQSVALSPRIATSKN